VAKTTEDLFDDIFDANIRGVYFTVQKAPPLLADGGAVVLATSWFVEASVARSSTISASKAARLNLTRTLASELIGRNIRVNAVSAGTIETSLFGKLGPSGECADNGQCLLRIGHCMDMFGRLSGARWMVLMYCRR
jgi:NAD(P)-dependent dehydrogenase (short-subunit alcohol dehydrogenase family)